MAYANRKWDGVPIRRSAAIAFRDGDPSRDVDGHGDPVKPNYVVFVRIKDCPVLDCTSTACIERRGAHKHYDPNGAKQAFRVKYGGTNYGFTKWKLGYRFWESHMYVVIDGVVFVGTIRRNELPEFERLRLFREKGIITRGTKVLK